MSSTDLLKQRWIVGVSGASGMRYALRLLDVLCGAVGEVHAIFTDSALRVLQEEEGIALSASRLSAEQLLGSPRANLFFHPFRDIGAELASGSAPFEGMVVIPCSMATLAAIAAGLADNLLHRAADVTIKERRPLILVPRETPISSIHLRNMLTLSDCGVSIVPAMPGFYHRPTSIDDLIDMQVMKVLDQMRIPSDLVARWKQENRAR